MRQVTLVVLALLLCAGTGWSILDTAARKTNQSLARRLQEDWDGYKNALSAVYTGTHGGWHRLAVTKVFLQKSLYEARKKVDWRDPVSARRLEALRLSVAELFEAEEIELRDSILGQGHHKVIPEGKE